MIVILFTYPSFIGVKEQTPSEILYNNVKILIQTHVGEIWTDLDFGSNIRNLIKQGIDEIILSEIVDEIGTKINEYFKDDLIISNLEARQDINVVRVRLDYIELRTGIHNTVQTEEAIINNSDQTLY